MQQIARIRFGWVVRLAGSTTAALAAPAAGKNRFSVFGKVFSSRLVFSPRNAVSLNALSLYIGLCFLSECRTALPPLVRCLFRRQVRRGPHWSSARDRAEGISSRMRNDAVRHPDRSRRLQRRQSQSRGRYPAALWTLPPHW